MKLARSISGGPPDADVPASHVLCWVPGLVTRAGGGWELRDARAYEAAEPGSGCPVLDAPRDTPAEQLALWAAGQLGCPADIRPARFAVMSCTRRPFSVRLGTELIYYIRPSAGGEAPT
jgi:hypothetical protein